MGEVELGLPLGCDRDRANGDVCRAVADGSEKLVDVLPNDVVHPHLEIAGEGFDHVDTEARRLLAIEEYERFDVPDGHAKGG